MEISSFYVVVKHVITCYSSFGFGAIVAQERQKVGCRDYGTRNGHTKRAQIKGVMYSLLPVCKEKSTA